jgi:hypothetical protein
VFLGYNLSAMKLLIVALFVTIFLNVGTQEVSPHANPPAATKDRSIGKLNSEQKADKANSAESASPPVPSRNQCQNCCPVNQQQAKSKEEEAKAASLDRLYRRYMYATIIGVVGGFIGIGILIWQGVLLRRSTRAAVKSSKSAKRSADAALLNAQAVINAERPWVIIFAAHTKSGAFFRAGNLGRTPAEIISFSAEHRCVEHIGELPAEPEFTIEYVPQIKLLVPGGKFGESQDIELLSEDEFINFVDTCRKESGHRTLPTPPKMSVFYFRVRYTYAGERLLPGAPPYESRACFCYQPADAGEPLRNCGNKSYNCYT